jgi:uncharacterized membrane protein (DUF485 family)
VFSVEKNPEKFKKLLRKKNKTFSMISSILSFLCVAYVGHPVLAGFGLMTGLVGGGILDKCYEELIKEKK